MDYISYQHIEKLGTTETEGILTGEVHLSYKIDGSNGCIFLKDDKTLGFGSRKRELTIDNDNMGFMASFILNKELYNKFLNILNKYKNYIIYGEWLVPVTIKRYESDAWKKFYVFDILDVANNRYLRFDEYKPILDEYSLLYIPELAVLCNPTIDEIKDYLNKTNNFLITEGFGEGIVIKNYEYKNCYGRRTWAKILTEDFIKNKKGTRLKNHLAKETIDIEQLIINAYLTVEHVLKEKHKIEENRNGWSSKYILELLNRTYDEFLNDNLLIIIKKFRNPTINFRKLKMLSDDFVKEILGL